MGRFTGASYLTNALICFHSFSFFSQDMPNDDDDDSKVKLACWPHRGGYFYYLAFIVIYAGCQVVFVGFQSDWTIAFRTLPGNATCMGTGHLWTRRTLFALRAFVRVVRTVHFVVAKLGQMQTSEAILEMNVMSCKL
jgi:hypothetical protein